MVKELISEGELNTLLPESAKKVNSKDKLIEWIKSSNILAIIDGEFEQPETQEGIDILMLLKKNFKDFICVNSKDFDESTKEYLLETFKITSPYNHLFEKGSYIGQKESLLKYLAEHESEI